MQTAPSPTDGSPPATPADAQTGPRTGLAAPTRPLRVALVQDHPIVMAGLTQLLAPYASRVVVRDLDVASEPGAWETAPVDVLLHDTFARLPGRQLDLRGLCRHRSVVVFSWAPTPAAVGYARYVGAAGIVSKGLGALELLDALEEVARSRVFVARTGGATGPAATDRRPRHYAGLSTRELDVLGLVGQGLGNQEIAESLFLGINSVRTYVRSAYGKTGVHTRTQAVLWCVDHGFQTVRERTPAGRT